MSLQLSNDLSQASALVVDNNTNTRSIMVAQLRELGVKNIQQAFRTQDARNHLENQTYDIVLCEQNFPQEKLTGQDLLDDLRRGNMLPFATIFIMVTSEASYTKVAEAAESMLDSYLLKPFTGARLMERIASARQRKVALQHIYQAVEDQEFAHAARLCLLRFNDRSDYWMYAARVGAELLLRLAHFDTAMKLYEAVVATEPVNWARLGVARTWLEMGQPHKAKPVLENLLAESPEYADAYDNLARALMELGQFEGALAAYQQASTITPSSISRLQRHGMLAHFLGDPVTAGELLENAVRLGLSSKMFDGQTLVLLSMQRYEAGDSKQFHIYYQDLQRLAARHLGSVRLARMVQTLGVLEAQVKQGQAEALVALQALTDDVLKPDFDFESACNLLSVLALLSKKGLNVPDVDNVVRKIGLRFATSKAMSELLVGAAHQHERYSAQMNECNAQVLKLLEQALAPSMTGQPGQAVETLLEEGKRSLNAKVIETGWLVLKRHEAKIPNATALAEELQHWRQLLGTAYNKPVLGDRNMRQSGGVSLRGMETQPLQPTMVPSMPTVHGSAVLPLA